MKITRSGHVECMGDMRNAYRMLARKSEGKKPLGIPKCRCEDNINVDLNRI